MHGLRRKMHFPRVRSFDQGALLSAKRGTAAKLSSTILPRRAGPKDPSCKATSGRHGRRNGTVDIRALIPMQSDPLKIEVDSRPQDVRDPSTVVLFRFGEPISKLYENRSSRRRSIC